MADRLGQATANKSHEFWSDSVSIVEKGRLRWDHVLTSRQITDVYLLALAVAKGGRLVTLDRSIAIKAVPGANTKNLLVLGRVTEER